MDYPGIRQPISLGNSIGGSSRATRNITGKRRRSTIVAVKHQGRTAMPKVVRPPSGAETVDDLRRGPDFAARRGYFQPVGARIVVKCPSLNSSLHQTNGRAHLYWVASAVIAQSELHAHLYQNGLLLRRALLRESIEPRALLSHSRALLPTRIARLPAPLRRTPCGRLSTAPRTEGSASHAEA